MTTNTYDRIRLCRDPRTLARAAQLFVQWDMRPEADAAHIAKVRLMSRLQEARLRTTAAALHVVRG